MIKKHKKHKYIFLRFLFKLIHAFDPRKAVDFKKSAVKKILLVSTTAIGDLILSTPAIRAVRKAFPDAFIAVLAHEKRSELLRGNPYINEVISYAGKYKGAIGLVKYLRGEKFDIAAVLHGNDPDIVPLIYLSGIPVRAGWAESKFSFLLTHTYGRPPRIHLIRQRLNILKTLGIPDDGDVMDLFISRHDSEFIEKYVRDRGASGKMLIGLHPFGSVQSRHWGNFTAFIDGAMSEFSDCVICVVGGKNEAGIAEKMVKDACAGKARIIVAAGELSLGQSAALIKKCSCFITTDSGPMQMALALKAPTVVLAGPADMKRTGPLDLKNNIIIQKDVECYPCNLKQCGHHVCMESITFEDVIASVKKLM